MIEDADAANAYLHFVHALCEMACTIGFLIGTFSIMVSDGIHYLKKRMRMKKEQKEQNNE